MTSLSKVRAEASKAVVPGRDESSRVEALADQMLARTRKVASKHREVRDVVLGGSFAKGTWLPDETDLDIFVRFDVSTPEDVFERLGLAIGAAATAGHPRGKKFAQHPYTEAAVEGVKVNLVPCYDVPRGEWKSAADRSPFHVDLVRGVPEATKTDIRLLKKFMKSVGVYGAELETQGFSGYVAEVLVMNIGGFVRTLEWFSGLDTPQGGRRFSLPDPVDQSRDLGVAVSAEKLGRMVLASREFLKHPRPGFFKAMHGRSRPELRSSVVAVVFSHRKLSEDIIWGELRKTARHLVRHLEVRGFRVARFMSASNNSDRSAILLIPEFDSLPEAEQRVGPTVDRSDDLRAFLSSNRPASRLVWVDDEARVRILRHRDYVEIEDLLADFIRGRAGPTGASREMELGLKATGRVVRGSLLAKPSTPAWLLEGIREITTDAIGTG